MSMPGWYPDPSGQPGRFRYWDGTSWSPQTTATPQTTPAPQPFGAPGGGQSGDHGGGRRPVGWLLGLLAGLLALALVLWFAFGRHGGGSGGQAPEDTSTARPSVSAWNETAPPSPSTASPSDPQPSGGALVSCPDTGGDVVPVSGNRIQGGGLSASTADGWQEGSSEFTMRWAHATQSQTYTVESNNGHSWFSVISLSSLARADGFTSPSQAAAGVMSCFASSSYYEDFTGTRSVLAQPVSVGGHTGYRMRNEVYVNDPAFADIRGDVVDVEVVDTGNADTFGVFVSSYTIGDSTRGAQVDAVIASITAG